MIEKLQASKRTCELVKLYANPQHELEEDEDEEEEEEEEEEE